MEQRQDKSHYTELLRKSEIKRIGENLTKRELTDILGIHYNFYWNCVTGRNNPSQNLIEALEVYLNTPTVSVYETIFALRANVEKTKKVKRDKDGKELYHESLEISPEYAEKVRSEMEQDGVFKAPQKRYMKA